jgi:hypothetical protein
VLIGGLPQWTRRTSDSARYELGTREGSGRSPIELTGECFGLTIAGQVCDSVTIPPPHAQRWYARPVLLDVSAYRGVAQPRANRVEVSSGGGRQRAAV